MKYVRTFESFKNNKNEPVNEEFLGAIGKWLGNMFKKAQEHIRKTEGGQEVEAIYQKYLKLITDKLQEQAGVVLNLTLAKNETVKENKINEAEEAVAEPEEGVEEVEGEKTEGGQDSKMSAESLTKKSAEMDKIVLGMKTIALKEMDAVLKNKGGATKNPKLQTIIDIKKSQFDLDFMNAKIGFYEKSGDKTMVGKISKERDVVAKTIAAEWKTFDKKPEDKEGSKFNDPLEVGKEVVYKRKEFNEDNWKKLIEKIPGNKPQWINKSESDESPMKEMIDKKEIGILKISKIEGDKVELEGKSPIPKTVGDILLKVNPKEGDSKGEETEETPTEETPTEENPKETK